MAKPFLKWAGGKGQLLSVISENLPLEIETYIEPFVGSGAVLFNILNERPGVKRVIINDINSDLINTYKVIKDNCGELISILQTLQEDNNKKDAEGKAILFYSMREEYNLRQSSNIRMAALFIFLNRTCFNGLYRVNAKNQFNVPCGKYANPKICDADNLMAVSSVLGKVELFNGDYEALTDYCKKGSFVYLDPPYKPISETSSFNSYSADKFDDDEQVRLKLFCDKIASQGANFMLSNSDPQSVNSENDFFDKLYKEYHIRRVQARRNINSVSSGRGVVNELLITNYENESLLFG